MSDPVVTISLACLWVIVACFSLSIRRLDRLIVRLDAKLAEHLKHAQMYNTAEEE